MVQALFTEKIPGFLEENPDWPLEKAAGYLVVMAKNRAIDKYRSNRVRSTYKQNAQDAPDHPDLHRAAAAQMPGSEDGTAIEDLDLRQAMDALEPKYREVLTLHYVLGYPWLEVASRVGISIQGVKKQAAKALEKLSGHYRK